MMFIVMLLLCNAVVAQDRIILTWRSSHANQQPSGSDLVIRATNGEPFTIDWGDDTPIETTTGLGNIDILLTHRYPGDEKCATVTIAASNDDCNFTYFDCHTFFEDDNVTFQIDSLTFDGCSDLEYLYCERNALQLSDLYAAQLIIKEQSGRLFGTQILPYQPLTGGMSVDFSAQRIIGGVETFFQVSKRGCQAIFNVDYTIDNGVITFITDGEYTVTMTNGAIISHPNYPAEVIAGLKVHGISIPEKSLPNIKIYPNPTIGELKIESGELRIEDVVIYDIFGKIQRMDSWKTENTIDIYHISAGIYFVRICTAAGEVVKKVLKE